MYSKKLLSTIFLFSLITTNLNFIYPKEQIVKSKKQKTEQPSKFEILKKKTSELLNKLKEKNKNNPNKEYEEEIKKLSMIFGALNALITIPSMDKDGKDEIIEMFGDDENAKVYGFLYLKTTDITNIIKKSFNASIEVDDSLLIDLILHLQKIISYTKKSEEISRAIGSELIDFTLKKISHKLIKVTQNERITRRILRTSADSLITAASKELIKENNTYGFVTNFIVELLINAMSETIGEGLIRTIEKAQEDALKN